MDISHDLDKIAKYRDRFSAWSLVIGFLSFTLAVWTTAPSLEVELPLVAGTDVSINIGYILSIGIPVLTFAVGLTYSALFTMRSYQEGALEKIEQGSVFLGRSEALTLAGPLAFKRNKKSIERLGYRISFGTRIFIFFVLPILAQIWILAAYTNLSVYTVESTIAHNSDKTTKDNWNIHKIRTLGIFTEWEISRPENTYLPDATLERKCADIFANKDEDNSGCVYSNFPRFMPILNGVVNLVFFVLLLLLVRAGYVIYVSRDIATRVLSASKKPSHA
ncbi:MAG: hypothetical protein AB2689_04290 [Candidatus Thiodiazotropha taylori]